MTPQMLEGTWEEVAAHSAELAGHKVRLIVLPSEANEPYLNMPEEERPSTGASLLQYAGTWAGDDLEQRLQEVYATRSKAQF